MTPVALGARSSSSPHPAGRPVPHVIGGAGSIAWPSGGNPPYWFNANGGTAQLGPFNLPYRFWLATGVNYIIYPPTSPDWNRYDAAIYLFNGSAYTADLNGQTFHQNADSMPGGGYFGDWNGANIETRFYCEANINWYVRFLSMGNGAGNQYYQHPFHLNFWAYTVGEGVY